MVQKYIINPNYDINSIILIIQEFISIHSKTVVIITGPTGSGKTNISHKLYSSFNSMLISADSRQIYKDVNIGSNKPRVVNCCLVDSFYTAFIEDNKEIFKYWNLDELNLSVDFSAQKFRQKMRRIQNILQSQDILPIIVGGSVHWLRSLISENISPYYESDIKIYSSLKEKSLLDLQNTYISVYEKNNLNDSDWNNSRRLMRAIEFKQITKESLYVSTMKHSDEYNYLVFETEIDRTNHRDKIRQSVTQRLDLGWINEVQLINKKYNNKFIFDKLGLGYMIISEIIDKNSVYNIDELIEKITIAEMRYTKKQKL